MLQALIGTISAASKDLNVVYEELRQNVSPVSDTHRRIDTCSAVTKKIVESAWSRLGEGVEGQDPIVQERCCTDTGSVFSSIASKSSYGHSRSSSQSLNNSSVSSRGSSLSSVKKQEAAAEIAATEAALEILQLQEREIEELQRLEAEEKRRVAEQVAEAYKRRLEREEEARLRVKFEAENAARQKALEDKRRELEHLETLKNLNAAKARMQVCKQTEDSKDETRELLHDCVSVQKKHV